MRDWNALRPKFRAVVFRRSVTEVAREIPASRDSVYNWLSGRRRPMGAAQARIEEIVNHDAANG